MYLNDKDVLFWLAGTLVIDSLFRITPFGLDGLSALDYWTMIFSILMVFFSSITAFGLDGLSMAFFSSTTWFL